MYQTKVLLVNEKCELDRCQGIDLQSVKVLESLVVNTTYTFVFLFCFCFYMFWVSTYFKKSNDSERTIGMSGN